MAKSYKSLFEKIVNFENLLLAAKQAQKGKRMKQNVAEFNFGLESELLRLQKELKNQTYAPGKYRHFYVNDPKRRLISAAPYRDRVVHHAFCNIVEPLFDKTFIEHSYACRIGKGTHRALDRCQKFLRANRYVLQCDISRYFSSVNHQILLSIIGRKIKDEKVMWLAELIINSVAGGEWVVARKRENKNGEGKELQGSNDMEKGDRIGQNSLQGNGEFSPERNVWADEPDAQGGSFGSFEHSRGPGQKAYQGICPVSSSCLGFTGRSRDPDDSVQRTQLSWPQRERKNSYANRRNSKDDLRHTQETRHSPLSTNHSKGIPIGNLTSQFFANLYLNELDYFVKFDLRKRYYLRYMDDFLIFGNDKRHLHILKEKIREFLEKSLQLNLHPKKSIVFPTKSGVDFCGFRIFKDYRKLRKSNVKLFVKRMKQKQEQLRQGQIELSDISRSLQCWVAHVSYGNTYNLRKKLFKKWRVVSGEWRVISNEARQN